MLALNGTPAYAGAPKTQSFSVREVNTTLCAFPVEFGGEGVMRIFDSNRADFTYNLHLTIWYENLNTGERIYSVNVNRQQLWYQNDGTYIDIGVGIWALFHLPGEGHGMIDVGKIIITGPINPGTVYDVLYHNGAFDPSNGNFMLGVCDVLG
jgi:hypothetical protein